MKKINKKKEEPKITNKFNTNINNNKNIKKEEANSKEKPKHISSLIEKNKNIFEKK